MTSPLLKQTHTNRGKTWWHLTFIIVAMASLLLTEPALVNVLQRVCTLQRQLRCSDAGQCVLFWKHPWLQTWIMFTLPLWILDRSLVDLPHCLRKRHRDMGG